eukprot:CAMPEP_0198138336 /NCGR_PEP_ID=MMETSP1443-20131203/1737_1 /TAXON_ID=186043 /ORGANISM="Entomoneis sp., Strain CCMP2396" /LENGTH=288 /DNA_ID=CAMNT_0043800059 /DNA_START=108 /DNA_END=974 /DNA_ORIENTATION=-
MSSEATQGQTDVQYGQLHPAETPELLAKKRVEFEEELKTLPTKERKSFEQAQEKCPELLTDDFKLMFLRSEVFNADLAAKRYAHYWDERIETFGPEKAFQQLTIEKALKDDWTAFSRDYITFMPDLKDPMGRSIVFINPSKHDPSKYERISMVRALWYHLHAALESKEAQKHGVIVFIIFQHHAKLSQFDREMGELNMSSLQGAIPVRLSAMHVIRPPTFFKITRMFMKMLMSERTTHRVIFHFGEECEVFEKLATFRLERNMLPVEVGGDVEVDVAAWLEKCKSANK